MKSCDLAVKGENNKIVVLRTDERRLTNRVPLGCLEQPDCVSQAVESDGGLSRMTPTTIIESRRIHANGAIVCGPRAISLAIASAFAGLFLLGLSSCSTRMSFDRNLGSHGEYSEEIGTAVFGGGYPRYQGLNFLNFDELVELSKNGHPGGDTVLGRKVDDLLTTPLIDNRAWFQGKRPVRHTSSKLGSTLRVATWNIEKSFRMAEVIQAMASDEAYANLIDREQVREGSETWHNMLRQRERVASADIIFLQEMDIGVNRSDYLNAAEEMAKAMGMNYAYATQAIECDPVLLGLEPITNHDTDEIDIEATNFFRADPARFKGCFGSAVLSRYPIKYVEVVPLKTIGYDWYADEKVKPTYVEQLRRVGSKLVFDSTLSRELKVGGRNYFRVDLDVPGVGGNNTLTVINMHLEIKCLPKVRNQQMREILSYIKDIPNPVVMAGDFNASPIDISPTSVPRITRRLAKDPQTWLNVANEIYFDLDWASLGRNVFNFAKNLHSPLAPNVPVLLPNKIRPLIDEVEDFRFADGSTFDFRGDAKRSMGTWHSTLSNSNQKKFKGQVQTFKVKRTIGPIGFYRLDWFFVRSGWLGHPKDRAASYQLAPHFGETLVDFNRYLERPLSDHRPSVVDLPLTEPVL